MKINKRLKLKFELVYWLFGENISKRERMKMNELRKINNFVKTLLTDLYIRE